jgi:hypothetical protein
VATVDHASSIAIGLQRMRGHRLNCCQRQQLAVPLLLCISSGRHGRSCTWHSLKISSLCALRTSLTMRSTRRAAQSLILEVADALETSGLRKLGYTYINLDDCWAASARNATGHVVGDPTTFPHGMKWLGDSLHAKGFSFGLYTARNIRTCSGKMPGSLHNEVIDATTFASYGADFVKNDDCGV